MRARISLVVMVVALACAAGSAQALVNPSKPGDIFIDHHGSTVQLTECRGSGPTEECRARVLKQSPDGPTYGAIWWTLDTLRGSESIGARMGLAPYAGPAVPLPGAATTRPAAAPGRAAANPAAPVAQAQAAPVAQGTATGGRCTPPTPYTGAVAASRAPSPALFRELIANLFTVDGNAQYPRKVDYRAFTVGATVTNSVGMTNQGANRVTNGAPVGAQLYPIKASFSVCKAEWSKLNQYEGSSYFCWRAGKEWACGAG